MFRGSLSLWNLVAGVRLGASFLSWTWKGPKTSALVLGCGPYGAFQRPDSDCTSTSEETCISAHTGYQTRGERESKEKERERGRKCLPSFPALQSHLHWCVWPSVAVVLNQLYPQMYPLPPTYLILRTFPLHVFGQNYLSSGTHWDPRK